MKFPPDSRAGRLQPVAEVLTRVESALQAIPADDRNTWVLMAMAIKSELGEAGFPVWDKWSQQAELV